MRILIAITLILVSGCAELNSLRSGVGYYGQQASDSSLHDAVWVICKATPVGAVKRRFNTMEKIVVYDMLCNDTELMADGLPE
tara:strand:- start:34041 stop:34289 length:249 start_codon:yes stop_codon:yes gene_type:complete